MMKTNGKGLNLMLNICCLCINKYKYKNMIISSHIDKKDIRLASMREREGGREGFFEPLLDDAT
jgi:hypothetical protein